MSKHSSKGPDWERTRLAVLARDGHVCRLQFQGVCTTVATTVDHVVAKVHGGSDDPSNLVAACHPCNLRKGSKVLTRSTYRNPRFLPA